MKELIFRVFSTALFLLPKTDSTDVKEDHMRTEPVTMNEFAEAVRQDLQERLSGMYPQLQVNIQHVEKLQGESYLGVRIDRGDGLASPVIDLEGAFHEMKVVRPYEKVLADLTDTARSVLNAMPEISAENLRHYDQAKNSLMLERGYLSRINGWYDERGHPFIFFTIEEVMRSLSIGRSKAIGLLSDLEKSGLILRVRQGLGKPNRIYVGRFYSGENPADFRKYENQTSGSPEINLQEVRISATNKNDKSKTEKNKTNLINQMDPVDEMRTFFDISCGFEALKMDYPYRADQLEEIRELLVEVCTTTKPTLADMMERVIRDEPILPCEGVLKHSEGVDLMPGNIALSGLEASLVNVMSRETYGKQIKIYKSEIPRSIRAAEISAAGRSIFRHDPKGKVAGAYRNLTKEVLADGNRRLKRSKEECL